MTDNNNRYFTLLTDKGKFKIAKAAADKGEVKFSHFAIGDGGGQEVNPTPNQTALVHEVWRAQLDSVEIDPKNPAAVIINAIIPHNVGGWWMREFGLFDVDGDMLAVVKPAPNYKATSAEGQLEDVYYEFQLVIGEQAQVVVLVDPSILWATREYVETRRISAGQMMNTPWLPVKALNVATPPSSNNQGDTYVIPTGAKGDWKDKSGQLAEWNGKAWTFVQTPDGHGIGLPDGQMLQKVNGVYVPQVARDVQSGKWLYAEASGTANALTATLTPTPRIYSVGMAVRVKVQSANTGPATINLNGLGAKTILNVQGQPLHQADLMADAIVELVYNGDAFVMTSTPSLFQTGGVAVFDQPGAFQWTFPAGVNRVWAEVYGAGGGACESWSGDNSEGGGGGGYAAGWIYGQPGQVINGYVGQAGKSAITAAETTSGGTTTIHKLSGTGGLGANEYCCGVGGQGFGGEINLRGGSGGDGGNIVNTRGQNVRGGDAAGPHGGKGGEYRARNAQSWSASWPGGGAMMMAAGGNAQMGTAADGGVILFW